MLTEFTFVTYSYNHEDYIIEHLDSIKMLMQNYANGIEVDYICIDDASTDHTESLIQEWLKNNGQMFRNVKQIFKQENKGMVDSYCCALREIETDCFKAIAGDDKFYLNDIFELYEDINKKIIVTPCVLFGNNPSEVCDYLMDRFRLAKYLGKKTKIVSTWENLIQAPGAVWDFKSFDKSVLMDRLSKYRMIEDYPSWRYLLDECDYEIKVIDKPYVCYRIGCGVSTGKTNQVFQEELERLFKEYNVKGAGKRLKNKFYRGLLKLLQKLANRKYRDWQYPV